MTAWQPTEGDATGVAHLVADTNLFQKISNYQCNSDTFEPVVSIQYAVDMSARLRIFVNTVNYIIGPRLELRGPRASGNTH